MDQVELLCLDHVNDDGVVKRNGHNTNQQQVAIAGREYRPDLYQLLCWTCNAAKAKGITCTWH